MDAITDPKREPVSLRPPAFKLDNPDIIAAPETIGDDPSRRLPGHPLDMRIIAVEDRKTICRQTADHRRLLRPDFGESSQ